MTDNSLLDSNSTFTSFSHVLDSRILRALADMAFARPTLVQSKVIPLTLEGRDILARARTGSGKTAAYCIPVIQKILNVKSTIADEDPARQAMRALVLVPTRELSEQVLKQLNELLVYCESEVTVANLASGTTTTMHRILASEKPDILIMTPSRALGFLQTKVLSLAALETLVIDEADLIFSYGHDEDIRAILNGSYLPKVYQSLLMSATMTKDVEELKGLMLRNPAILRLEEDEDDAARLTQYAVRCNEVDKFLLTYVILKLKLVKGKSIIFVNDVDRCYRLKLFLEQFSIKSCVLNSELPLNTRVHIVQEFNKGVYDYIIATDESSGSVEADSESEPEAERDQEKEDLAPAQRDTQEPEVGDPGPSSSSAMKRKRQSSPVGAGNGSKKKKTRVQRDKEYGVVRGVDFIDVACVLNFDLPTSSRVYTHRVGRTARAGRTGMSLSFIVPETEWGKNKVVGCLESAKRDEATFKRIEAQQAARGSKIKGYNFDMKQVEAFRYRMQDALRAVTKTAIREARMKEIKTELLNSEKLKAHFEDNPHDLEYLRHDKPLHPTRIQSHMKYVPKYLMPNIGATAAAATNDSGGAAPDNDSSFVPFHKNGRGRGRGRGRGGKGFSSSRGGRKKADPLKKFGK